MQQKVVFKLDVFEEKIKQKAMKAVCEFPGVTMIDVREIGKLKVTGEFDKYQMTKKLKKIYEFVDIIALEQDEESKPKPHSSSSSSSVKKPEHIVKKTSSFRGWKIGFF